MEDRRTGRDRITAYPSPRLRFSVTYQLGFNLLVRRRSSTTGRVNQHADWEITKTSQKSEDPEAA